jgi:hypothetical protein
MVRQLDTMTNRPQSLPALPTLVVIRSRFYARAAEMPSNTSGFAQWARSNACEADSDCWRLPCDVSLAGRNRYDSIV